MSWPTLGKRECTCVNYQLCITKVVYDKGVLQQFDENDLCVQNNGGQTDVHF